MGTGKEVLFWEDNWVERGALKTVFPRLYSLSVSKAYAMATFGGMKQQKVGMKFRLEKESIRMGEANSETTFSGSPRCEFRLG